MKQRFIIDSNGTFYDTHRDCCVSDEKILNALNLLYDILGGQSGVALKQTATDLGWNINEFSYQEQSNYFLMSTCCVEYLICHLIENTM